MKRDDGSPAASDRGDPILIDAHRHRRGPYTAAGDLVCAFVDRFGEIAVGAAGPRLTTLLPIRPELAQRLAVPDLVAQSLEFTREGNRRNWTLRSAHAIAEFLIECLVVSGTAVNITVRNLDRADPTDIEFLEVLRRRADPCRLSLTIAAASDDIEPEAADAATLAAAARRCMHFAFYDAALEYGERACAIAEQFGDQASHDSAYRDRIFSLLLLDRWDEAEALCDRCLADRADPAMRIHAGYAKTILSVRMRRDRDLAVARRHIDAALAAAADLADPEARIANRAFLSNTLALMLTKQGDPAAALALMDEAIATLERDAPARFAREGMILFQNRARLHVHAGREAAALADLTRLLELEPGSAEALFDRAVIHDRAGRAQQAIADYTAALFWAPPHAETLLNRARLLWQNGDLAGAKADIDRGLAMQPGDARMLSLKGLIALTEADLVGAEAAFDQAIAGDSSLAEAWANRAIVRWRRGELEAAQADLDQAAALGNDPAIHRNRAKVAAALARRAVELSSLAAESRSQPGRLAAAARAC